MTLTNTTRGEVAKGLSLARFLRAHREIDMSRIKDVIPDWYDEADSEAIEPIITRLIAEARQSVGKELLEICQSDNSDRVDWRYEDLADTLLNE